MAEPTIEHVPDIHHYELRDNGDLIGHINYRDDGNRRVFLHTEVDKEYSGEGLATRLMRFALDDVRASMGWEPRVAGEVGTTPGPSDEELRLIREELDPEGVYTK